MGSVHAPLTEQMKEQMPHSHLAARAQEQQGPLGTLGLYAKNLKYPQYELQTSKGTN